VAKTKNKSNSVPEALLGTPAQNLITTLTTRDFYAACPCGCGENIRLREANLFYLDDFSESGKKAISAWSTELKEKARALKDAKKSIPERSTKGAQSTNIGFILERLAPVLDAFPFEPNDCRSIFDPIDYVIFNGLTKKGVVDHLTFVDIKTGEAKLSKKQRQIRDVIEDGNVGWDVY
jgi:predicted Holliday junction resolvase-like endonuclease